MLHNSRLVYISLRLLMRILQEHACVHAHVSLCVIPCKVQRHVLVVSSPPRQYYFNSSAVRLWHPSHVHHTFDIECYDHCMQVPGSFLR